MKSKTIVITTVLLALFSWGEAADDKNHEIIEKVMKEGLKGKTSPLAKTISGEASEEEIKNLHELVLTLEGTKAPKGEQDDYDEKVSKLIETLGKVAEGDGDEKAIAALKKASNCKACHSEHKPE